MSVAPPPVPPLPLPSLAVSQAVAPQSNDLVVAAQPSNATSSPLTQMLTFRRDELYRLSIDQYHALIATGVLSPSDRVEFIDGLIVQKMPKNPIHEATIAIVYEILRSMLPNGWTCRAQGSITLNSSEPEPDLAVFRGRHQDYLSRHPGPSDMAMVLEVSDSSLLRDRTDKLAIYARAAIPTYIILNLTSGTLEVHTEPDAPAARYRTVHTLARDDTLKLVLPGTSEPLTLPVTAMLP